MTETNRICIRNCNLIDGYSEELRINEDIFIIDGSIEAVGNDLKINGNYREIDLTGKIVLPGFIDVHVHTAFDGSEDPLSHLLSEDKYQTLIKMVMNCQAHLNHGVTSVRDLGGPRDLLLNLRDAWKKRIIPGPRLIISGNVITSKKGHCYFIGHEAESLESAREAAINEIKYGVDVIKIMASGGTMTPGSSVHNTQFDVNEISAIVDYAHKSGIKVAAHANALKGIENSIQACVDSIEHGSFADDSAISSMLDKGIWLVPTMYPADILIKSSNLSDERKQQVKNNWHARKKVVQKAIKNGLKLASGTDAGTPFVQHGHIAQEIRLFHDLGMKPMHAIWTATSRASELLGISDQIGEIIEGKCADLIVVAENPLENIRTLELPEMVMIEGVIYKNTINKQGENQKQCEAINLVINLR